MEMVVQLQNYTAHCLYCTVSWHAGHDHIDLPGAKGPFQCFPVTTHCLCGAKMVHSPLVCQSAAIATKHSCICLLDVAHCPQSVEVLA